MENFDLTLSLNSEQIQVSVHPHIINDKTYYDIMFEDYTLSIFKNTLYTWDTENSNGLSQADIQSIGEQIDNR